MASVFIVSYENNTHQKVRTEDHNMILLYKPQNNKIWKFKFIIQMFTWLLFIYICISVKLNSCGENIYFLNDKVIQEHSIPVLRWSKIWNFQLCWRHFRLPLKCTDEDELFI